MMPLVFVVDGVAERRKAVQYALEQAGYLVETFATTHALEVAEQHRPAAMIIAAELPDGNGIDLCRQIRQRPTLSRIRVLLLADNKKDKYRAVLESSADECVIGPATPGEIAAAIETILDHRYNSAPKHSSDIVINASAMRVAVRGKEITTTTLEFRLIDYMARHQGKVFTRDALLDAVWGDLQFVTPRSVDACVRRIRRKIEPNSSSPTFLKSIRGVGYRLDATPAWEAQADFCQCEMCSASRKRAKTVSPQPVARMMGQARPASLR